MLESVALVVFCLILAYLSKQFLAYMKRFNIINKIPGPRAIPLIGNVHSFPLDRVQFTYYLLNNLTEYGRKGLTRLWLGVNPLILIMKANIAEELLSSNVLIEKSNNYDLMKEWIGSGLLISSGPKWKKRRKMLTPTFHFSILNTFIEVFDRESRILVDVLSDMESQNVSFDVYPFVGRCALDIICDTAMGTRINAQLKKDSPYVCTVRKMSELLFKYERSPWLWSKFTFYATGFGFEYDRCRTLLQKFTNQIIKTRSIQLKESGEMEILRKQQLSTEENAVKKRLAFLDLLLLMQDEQGLTSEDIREEVDTFMFEGHDTTASGMSWAIFLLGHHPEVQAKVFQEIVDIFGDDQRVPTADDLKQMKYLEAVVKESLRLFPPVPLFARRVKEDIVFNGYEIPKGSSLVTVPFMMQRDPETFGTTADQFIPERFLESDMRHPYAYVPFSAGPRNCIGQRFALMEEKIVLCAVIRNFTIKSIESVANVPPIPEIITRPPDKILISLRKRN